MKTLPEVRLPDGRRVHRVRRNIRLPHHYNGVVGGQSYLVVFSHPATGNCLLNKETYAKATRAVGVIFVGLDATHVFTRAEVDEMIVDQKRLKFSEDAMVLWASELK